MAATRRYICFLLSGARYLFIGPVLACIVLGGFAETVVATDRYALVIGNGAYQNIPPLQNPVNDARDMSEALRQCGFDVIALVDANRVEIRQAIREFGKRIQSTSSTGLFYYAGHGLQVKGENYIVPIGAVIQGPEEVEDECVKATSILRKMEAAGNILNIIILDACRNNPFRIGTRELQGGLARMNAPTGSILAYATAPDTTASDGTGRNGIFTSFFLKHLRTPGQKIEDLFKRVRIDVMKTTDGKQVPWEHSSLVGDFYFQQARPEPEVALAIPRTTKKTTMATAELTNVAAPPLAQQRQWSAWQENMAMQHRQIRDFIGRPDVSSQEKKQTIESFLAAYQKDNPYSLEDNEIRREASHLLSDLGVPAAPSHIQQQVKTVTSTSKATPLALPSPKVTGTDGPDTFENSYSMRFRKVAPGKFIRGTNSVANESPRHQVHLTRAFYLQETEVTRSQWKKIMGSVPTKNTDYIKGLHEKPTVQDFFNSLLTDTTTLPVTRISWNDARAFVQKLNVLSGDKGQYRLPTEAEWEYVSQAGGLSGASVAAGNINDSAWHAGNSESQAHPVKKKTPNAWGFYDMAGNVSEWCFDYFAPYAGYPQRDPVGPEHGFYKVYRGGNYQSDSNFSRPTMRGYMQPDSAQDWLGLRLVYGGPTVP